MGWLKKAFKGIKKVVKKVARGVKKVAKSVAYAIPGGKQLWKAGGKLGKNIMKGVGKVMGKLGPVGMMAISVVLSATGVGTAAAAAMKSMWSSFGATAAAAATQGSVLGTIGNAVYTGVNWASGTLGAVGDALVQGGKQLMTGSFSPAAKAFGTNITQALTGDAGMAAVKEGVASAAESVLAKTAGQSVLDQAISAGSEALAGSGGTLANLGTPTETVTAPMQSVGPQFNPVTGETLVTEQSAGAVFDPIAANKAAVEAATPLGQKLWEGAQKTVKKVTGDNLGDLVKSGAKSLLSPSSQTASMQPAVGYTTPIDTSFDTMYGQGFAGPQQAQSIQAASVGGTAGAPSYYRP